MRETSYWGNVDKKRLKRAYAIRDIFCLGICIGLIVFSVWIYKHPLTKTGFLQTEASRYFIIFMALLFVLIIFGGLLASKIGYLKSQRDINKEEKYIKKLNPYIYLRELPNDLGIGISSLLNDSSIENEKDIVAVILDLCAKGYLRLDKNGDRYILKVLHEPDDHLFKNEWYIMDMIKTGQIKNVNYNTWFDCCLEDGTNLGLYYHEDRVNRPMNVRPAVDYVNKIQWIVAFVLSFVITYMIYKYAAANGYPYKAIFILVPFLTLVMYIPLLVPFYLVHVFNAIFLSFKHDEMSSYNLHMNNHLTRTEEGIKELFKLHSFEAFLKDFGHFVDKRVDEVILWDRYLAYAQLFGLTKEIMKSGYSQLVNNSSFNIDDIDNIHFSNIDIK